MKCELGYEEGAKCGRERCHGTIETAPPENCSCHISPPCGSCTALRNFCPVCDWHEIDDPLVIKEVSTIYLGVDSPWVHVERKRRILDPTKIDYRIEMHSSSSQKCMGVYPQSSDPQADRKAVEARVRGTFGGRFERFGGGQFTYIAYTD